MLPSSLPMWISISTNQIWLESWLCHSVQYLSFAASKNSFRILSNSSSMFKNKCRRWKAKGPVGFCWFVMSSKNSGGYRKKLWSGSPMNHRTFGFCRIWELFPMCNSEKELCSLLPKSRFENHGNSDSAIWEIGRNWVETLVRERNAESCNLHYTKTKH